MIESGYQYNRMNNQTYKIFLDLVNLVTISINYNILNISRLDADLKTWSLKNIDSNEGRSI